MEEEIKRILEDAATNKITKFRAIELIDKRQKKENQSKARFSESENIFGRIYTYEEPYLQDHIVYGERVLLGVTHCSLAIEAAREIYADKALGRIHKLLFSEAIIVHPEEMVDVRVSVREKDGRYFFSNQYKKTGQQKYRESATGEYFFEPEDSPIDVDISAFEERSERVLTQEEIYCREGASLIYHGPSLRTVRKIFLRSKESIGELILTEDIITNGYQYEVPPALLDGAIVSGVSGLAEEIQGVFVPFMIKEVIIYGRLPEPCYCYSRLVKVNAEILEVDIDLCNQQGVVSLSLKGFTCKHITSIEGYKRIETKGEVTGSRTVLTSMQDRTAQGNQRSRTERDGGLEREIDGYLTKKFAQILNMNGGAIDKSRNFMDLGIDSTSLVELAQEIEKDLKIELYPTLFFEYQNLNELIKYFAVTSRDDLNRLFGVKETNADFEALLQGAEMSTGPLLSEETVAGGENAHWSATEAELADDADSKKQGLDRGDIAVIGMAGIFAESPDLKTFWQNIVEKKDLIKEIPPDHWDYRPWYDDNPQTKDKTYCKWGSFIDGVDKFDAGFFNISPREAEWMDPQLRLLLQSMYAAGEDAGCINQLRGTNTGVFVGVCFHDYADKIAELNLPVDPYFGTGNSQTVIANRVSFLFDFTGPSVAVDTACSSSLFALHYACHALRNNECDTAFVGGVNLLLSSWHYRYFCSIGALSPTGRCHTFDEAADGYVPGECIASILLKPLQQAKRDGDHIYAIIKGSAALHGGYTPSLTAPSVAGEANVILKAWENAGIAPETITYIEAHGTGTKLGDPIEINSLKKAFQRFAGKEHFCTIGSVKSNIGHAEGAAGIAGVLKVILQMKYKKLPAMPKFKTLNPYIQLDKTLYINQELEEWKSPAGVPRRAGVSSFGFSGAYAHVVIEEYLPKEERPSITVTSQDPAVIVLSAKNEERLKEQAQQLIHAIQEQQFTDTNLSDMAYTLQVGREAMEERVAVIVKSIKELEEKLKGFLEDREGIDDLYRGQVKRNKETLAVFAADEELQEAIGKWIQRRKYSKLLDLWVKGLIFDWNKLYGEVKPRRISLPTYPFAKERYWVPEVKSKSGSTIISTNIIHPLLHQNISDIYGPRYSSTFTGQEFFLADHVLQGRRILPGVAYLEIARAAVEQGVGVEEQTGIRLKNVVWTRPIVAGEQPVQVHISLFPEDSGEIAYEIYTGSEENGGEPVVHSQGSAVLSAVTEVPTLDIPALQAQGTQSSLSASQCYEAIWSNGSGLAIGSRLQGIEKVYVGLGQVLAKLSLPFSVSNTGDSYVLHPSLMDSALQSSIVLMSDGDTSGKVFLKPILPFALQELQVFGRCTSSMWALIRYSEGSKSGDKVQKLDIDVCDDQGNVCVRMKGFSSRVLEGEIGSAVSPSTHGTLMLEPIWKEQAVAPEALAPEYIKHLMILCEPDDITHNSIESRIEGVHCLTLQSGQAGIEERFQTYAATTFQEIQNILRDKPKGRVLVQIVVSTQKEQEQRLFSGLSGLLKTARLENPKLIGQLIEIESWNDTEDLIERLKENSRSPIDNRIRYQAGKRHITVWNQVQVAKEQEGIPWKDHGIYLITGGAGSLGLIFAEEITQKAKEVTLILTGRSELNEGKQARLKELEVLGAKVQYKQVDITDKRAVTDLIQNIQKEFGKINGIIHGAGVIRDNFIIKKTRDEFLEVLAPKVAGLVNLDEASKEINLDFFILFSSIAGSLGNTGQADYSTANAFMDAYAGYRNSLTAENQRRGKTLSINWPLWKEGGMRIDEANEKIMVEKYGMIPMQTGTGIRALYHGMSSAKDQVMVMEGNPVRMKQILLLMITPSISQPKQISVDSDTATRIDTDSLLGKVQTALMQEVSRLLKVKLEDIDIDAELSKYGFDSITSATFANTLNQEYQLELTPTIFFEHPTIHSFAEYLTQEHQGVFATRFAVQAREETPVQSGAKTLETAVEGRGRLSSSSRRHRFARTAVLSTSKPDTIAPEPIAIVGMSGIFPMAKDVNTFWRNLAEGKDCITEIPKNRWDWQEHYGDPTKETNKTNIKWGGFIEGVAEFDPLFFGISPKEAEYMDPQQRLMMTYIWKAIEDAGYSAQSLSGTKTAVFIGTASSGYSGLIQQANVAIEGYSSTGIVPSVGPNRMSYFLNIHGPSEPIETACSSSLVAIHRAVQAIQTGACETAIVGGVNTIITPELHISFNKAGMLCEDGRCKTFSDKANGYVRGEGVGMLIIKKLKAAEQAKDHIYGVIRGSAENHGGRANSLTAPNPKAQAELLTTAYTKAGIDPRTVTYIEAHGTGTELGDPIEINGLKMAFQELYEATGYSQVTSAPHCGLGSVKTNIGHLELAAGIAGVIKVLLQLKHKTLVRSIHCDTINPYIQLKDSPFYIVRETREWKALQDSQGNIPRRAGVSSFGFGGAYAHVVIEEYLPKEERPSITVTSQDPAVIVLSAKNEERLKEQAQQLIHAIREQQFTDTNLSDMAYTLQVGREAMEERIAVIVKSIKELEEKLKGFLEDREGIDDLYRGQVKRNKETLAVFAADEELQEAIGKWIQRRKYSKLLDLWVKGLIFDWNKLYGEVKPRRISLPTYPFAKERYWVPEVKSKSGSTIISTNIIHPLLHQNISDIYGPRYSSTFTGQEFFLADHVLQGRRILPGVAYLEIARAAVEQGVGVEEQTGIRLKNVVWTRPIVAGEQPVQVHISLFPEDSGEIAYEIYTGSEENGGEPVVHSQGSAVLSAVTEVPTLDIPALQAQGTQSSLSASQCYEAIWSNGSGLAIGSRLQGIEKVYVGLGQVLAKLSLPFSVSNTGDSYVLHPSLMDSALQSSIVLMSDGDTSGKVFLKPILPFALQELQVFGRCTSSMWALIRYSEGSKSGDKVQKLDIDVCDDQGNVCVRMKGFSSRVLEGEIGSAVSPSTHGTLMLEPIWKEQAVEDVTHENVELQKNGERYLTSAIPQSEEVSAISARIDTDSLLGKVQTALMQEVSRLLKVKLEDIDIDAELSKYGFDSITSATFANTLNQEYQLELTPTIFFEHPTIHSFAEYLTQEHQGVFATRFAVQAREETPVQSGAKTLETAVEGRGRLSSSSRRHRFARTAVLSTSKPDTIAPEPIAIVGMSGIFPMAKDVNTFWRNLAEGKDCITEIPKNRWDWQEHYGDPTKETNKTNIKWGGFIEGVAEFDPLFFGISPKEAEYMDPQQRLMMTYIWKAIEDAGYSAQSLSGTKTAVFIGTASSGYSGLIQQANVAIEGYSSTGIVPSVGPNRMSYFLNIHGPSEPIETACSSSLVAIHRAVQAIQTGACETAIVGGVNTIITPELHISFNKAGMLCEDGRCKTFSDKANGYVRGEGVGMLIIKKLKAAEQAKDHIYGVIRGSAENHGGRANSLTAPNPKAQAELLTTAYTKAGIDPRTVTYIEAHGTGTELGDPIEINGLKMAFQELYEATGYSQVTSAPHCGLGSVKTNIGHLELAAGIAGVIKVLLQLKHKTLVRSIHCDTINPYIQLKDSPFYIVRETREWKALQDSQGNIPRRAGVSSFGFGGAYAHVVIEEYLPKEERPSITVTSQDPAVIVLSAKNEERLKEQAQQLIHAIREQQFTDTNLSDMAYTLQVGREAMEERIAVIVKSIKELEEKLKGFLEDREGIDDLYRGQVKRNKETLAVFAADEELQEAIGKWIQRRKYSKLLDLWVKGLIFDWNKLYGEVKPRRISLPTYPFAKERYWVPEVDGNFINDRGTSAIAVTIHPLLHQNTSDFIEQRFTSTFTGEEFFLKDHVVKGRKLLPGVAYLEMARAATAQTSRANEEKTRILLRNIVWARPIGVNGSATTVHISLYPEDSGEIAYEIYTGSEGNGGGPVVHCQGSAELSAVTEVPTLNIPALQAECTQSSLSASQCYESFMAMGIDYGPGHRGIQEVYVDSDKLLAKLSLPSTVSNTIKQYILHPSMLDSALQSSIIFMLNSGDTSGKAGFKPALPFALQELQVLGRCTSSMWALIRYSEGSKSGDKVQKLDIDVCDDQGNVCVRMKGFSSRVLEGEIGSAVSPSTHGTLMLEPIWKEQAVAPEALAPEYIKHLMILCEPDDITHNSIESRIEGVHCLTLQSGQAGIEERFQTYAATTFQEIQNILRDKPKGRVLVQIVVSTQKEQEQRLFSGLSGLLKTARLENPKLIGQLIEIESWNDTEDLIERLKENSRSPIDNRIRYQAGKRHITVWNQVQVAKEQEGIPWKDHGIYLITGGAGSLGLIFAEEITQKAKEVTLILTGRSELNEGKQARLKELEVLGAKVQYKQVDITDKRAVTDLIQNIQKEFGKINGIIHGAGVIRDNFIIKKTRDEFLEVLAPKVAGLVNLDEASKEINLDFFILFSSIAGSLGNTGQADYSTANAFMDAYAGYRNSLTAENQRRGKTLSINWPLWKEGGMRIDEANEKIMVEKYGMIPMQTGTGIRALYHGMSSAKDQVMVMEGALKQLRTLYLEKQFADDVLNKPSAKEEKTVPAIAQDILREKATHYFKKLLSSVIKLPANRIEADAPMETYGIDSIMVAQLTNQLEKTFGSLSKTLFFEYQTIRELTGYFLESYRDNVTGLLGIEEKAEAPIPDSKEKDTVAETEPGKSAHTSRRRPRFASLRMEPGEEEAKGAKDIAIIGVSGRYPQARNIREFWKNLRDGKDCITEIPKDRWDHSLYFDEDKNKPGKTYSKWGGFIDDVDKFDPLFFNISPREAEIMDPQERLFLECVFETLEDAGYTRESIGLHRGFGLEGNIGVYVGVMYEEYQLYGAQEQVQGRPIALAGSPSSIANRVSYFCNFHGPSVALDTMCSSSLTAIHLACQSLERGGCEMAIAGGVNVSIHPNKYLFLGQGKFISSKGRCESFGQGGDGYVPGEGVGAVLLKPLSKAVADGDHIYGVIKATAINHGGKTNGYSVPNPNAQASVIGQAFKEAGITPGTISYIEAHGTGTSLGDPIEIAGLTKTFQEYTKDKQFCAIGSAKSNIGHCESAAGIAGVTKVLLQLKHRQLAPSLHSKALNPNIDFSNTPFVVQQELVEWKRPIVEYNGIAKEYPRIAGISSFGAGGSNAHVVIEEYLPKEERPSIAVTPQDPAIIVLSAKNEERLKEQTKQLLEAINEKNFSDRNLSDIAYTLQVGREAMEERVAVIVKSIKELEDKLKGFLENREGIDDLYRGQVKRNKETLAVFAADEDMAKTIDAWIAKRKYSKLLDLWVKGLIFDWNKLYGDNRPHRISLPTYPFARERYWVPEIKSKAGSIKTSLVNAASINEDRPVERTMYFLQKQWEPYTAAPDRRLNRTIAILTTKETRELAAQLSEHFSNSQIIDIHDLESHLRRPEQEWRNYDACVDLIGCGKDKHASMDWIVWLQQLIEWGHKEGLMILCATKGLENYQNSAVNLSGASRVGLYRMLQSEYGHLRSRHMDADPSLDERSLAQQIASELLMDGEDAEVCYRKGKRYRACLQELQEQDVEKRTPVFPEDHVLWITGGTRGLGYSCARHFVKHYGIKRLVLTGREAMPPQDQWDSYKQQHSSTAQKIQDIQALEAQGVHVRVLSVNLTDKHAVQQSLHDIKSTMGPAGGVIHCAGIADFENPAFIRKSVDGIQQVLDPKIVGLDMLYQNFHEEPLQFFLLFSSVSAVIPALASGQSDYAMANANMDYFAEANSHSCPIVSIQWPSWKDSGMGEAKSRVYHQTGLLSLTNAEGFQLLDHILSRKMGAVVLPAVVNPDIWKPRQLMQHRIQESPLTSIRSRRAIAMDGSKTSDALANATQRWLIELFSQELKIEPSQLETDIPFQDYGVGSVLLAQILLSINKFVAGDFDPSILYEYPTIKSFAAWLASTHASSLSKALGISISEQYNPPAQDSFPPASLISSESQTVIRELPKMSSRHNTCNPSAIAVIGLSCRFPGANTLEEYWQLLSEGRSAIRSVPQERWGYSNNFYAGLIDDIKRFDPKFFLIPDEDVKAMDPQALAALEESLKLWYHAGYSHQEIKGKSVGVYIGGRSQHRPNESYLRRAQNPIVAVGQNYLAANISHFFDLHGPSLVLDTACSSALVGMNMAIQALHSGEIESALVGGVSLLNTDGAHQMFQQRGILSHEPSYHVFDQRAGGVVLGEGVGMVLLKTVDQALEDGDHIYAVIKALAINNDGRTAGPATPNLQAQKEVMRTALGRSGEKAEDISYIEANGSGSEVTDILELKAIQSTYRSSNSIPCGLGSVKPNIGHPLCAEGIASFIKVVLMLQRRQFVPFLSGELPMKHYDIESSPFYFCRKHTAWTNMPRIAAINCFADGGTNAHVILEAWEDPALHPVRRYPMPTPELNRYDACCPEKATSSSALTNKGNGDVSKKIDIGVQEPSSGGNRQTVATVISIWKQKMTEE